MNTNFTKTEIQEIGRAAKYYREDLGMRWCKLEKVLKMSEEKLRHILCLYNEQLGGNNSR